MTIRVTERCEYVQSLVRRGHFDLDELRRHVEGCEICKRIYGEVRTELWRAARDAGLLDDEEGEAWGRD